MSKSDDGDDTNYFGVSKYGRDRGVVQDTYVDMTDAYANYGQYVISFQHLATQRTVFFKAFIKDYSEAFNASWTPTSVYGRTDPIQTYTGTTRKVTLAFDVPAASMGEAYENMGRVSKLVQMLYPTYIPNEESTGKIIGQAPLVRVKMMNLLTNERTINELGGDTVEEQLQNHERHLGLLSPRETLEAYRTSPLPENGVLAAIGNINYKSDFSKIQIFEKAPNTVLPQSVSVSLSFDVIHEETIGWDSTSKQPLARSFPHKVTLSSGGDMTQVGNDQRPADIETRIAQEERNQASDDQRLAQSDAFFDLLGGRKNR
tara:strand:- start:7095 stop:8042 length:948 start_codon:yes stop_codon:yes gene_type:complete